MRSMVSKQKQSNLLGAMRADSRKQQHAGRPKALVRYQQTVHVKTIAAMHWRASFCASAAAHEIVPLQMTSLNKSVSVACPDEFGLDLTPSQGSSAERTTPTLTTIGVRKNK
mmetsp:Transcript_111663/g.360364  ORF Transcript_111663/g.360364 Transcript_111663/m.360364 type:complete len:112 (+) Transcript_111663:188-523(+)